MEYKVTVIMPTYKRAKFLERAIYSVLNQSYNNIELIVVDDNDAESIYRQENEKLMQKYKMYNNVKYIKHEKNKNGAVARNTGIKEATGEYITFLDDDDFFLKNRIEKMVKILNENSKYDCAYSSVAYLKNGHVILKKEAVKKGNLLLDILSQNSFFGTGSNMFFRKKAIEKIGMFDETFIRHQDMEYMARFFKYGEVINLDEILVVKCVDDTQNVPNFEKMKKTKEQFLTKFENDINMCTEKEKENIYFCNYFELLTFAKFNSKEYKEIKKKLLKLKHIPFKEKKKIYNYELKSRITVLNQIADLKKKIINKKINNFEEEKIIKFLNQYEGDNKK